ncbi:hypothetical protein ACU6VI_08920 [Sphaerotilus natans]|uniref:hypothetical protein n=1 Tax=Sphaerotilus natans TaxID=34103 RepID=UPI00406C7FB8
MIDVQQLIRDLRLFADPATDVIHNDKDGKLWVDLVRDGVNRSYVIDLFTSATVARHNQDRQYASIQSLLASDEFVNLRAMRATQRRLLASKRPDLYINPEGQLLYRDETTGPLNLVEFHKALLASEAKKLTLLLLDGPAGIGKTSLIERIVYERADPASPLPPLLHVVSSGSRLTDLNKALAHATQVLRSNVTFDQVPVLVRLGVLQVAIDGFDELVDPEGYKDAWSALRHFLAEVHTGGPIILSGRDTFFDQQSFEDRLAGRISNLHLLQGRLQPISVPAAEDFLRQAGWTDTDLAAARTHDWFKPGSYQLRPFFLTQIGSQSGWAELQAAHGSPQSFLVSRFVTREADIVSRMVEISRQSAEDALWEFYGTLVEDMATSESEYVDEAYLALACELAFQNRVNTSDLNKLAFKAGSFGLLESDGARGLRKLPHSELQNQFLARVVARGLKDSAAVSAFLHRGVVNAALVEAFVDVLGLLPTEFCMAVRQRLMTILSEKSFAERLVSNSAALVLATLARTDLPRLELANVGISEAKIVGTAGEALLSDVSISHLDLRGADVRSVDFRACQVTTLTTDSTTMFGSTILDGVQVLQLEEPAGIRFVRQPAEIIAWLESHSARPTDGTDASDLPLVRYFDRLCRKFVRQHQIRNSASDEAYPLLRDPLWPIVQEILGRRLEEESRQAGGPKNVFYRLSKPEALLSPTPSDPEAQILRQRMIERARVLAN